MPSLLQLLKRKQHNQRIIMPFLILAIGIIIGVFALYRFFITSPVETVKKFLNICFVIVIAAIMLFFAMTGKIFISIGLALLLVPIAISRNKKKKIPPSKENEED